METDELFDRMAKTGFTKIMKLDKQDFIKETEDWKKRDVPKAIEDQIKNDCLIYCNYILDVLGQKKKFNMEEAKQLHQNVTKWQAKDFPIKD